MLDVKTTADGITFKIRVQPKSSRNQIVGLYGDALKIKITAAPVDGAANKMCIRFLAKRLGLSGNRLEIISGRNSRTKHVMIRAAREDQPALRNRIRSLPSTQ